VDEKERRVRCLQGNLTEKCVPEQTEKYTKSLCKDTSQKRKSRNIPQVSRDFDALPPPMRHRVNQHKIFLSRGKGDDAADKKKIYNSLQCFQRIGVAECGR
jgi:hypothetical protein